MASDESQVRGSRKRIASTDLSAEEAPMTPPRKAPRLDGHEDIEQDFDQALAPEPVKKAPKSSGKDKKLNRERLFEAIRATSFACLQIIGRELEDRRNRPSEMPLLHELAKELVKPLEELAVHIGADIIPTVTEVLRKRAIASVPAGFFTLAVPEPDAADEYLRDENLNNALVGSFPKAPTTAMELEAAQLVREVFLLALVRCVSPSDTAVMGLNPATSFVVKGDACAGITSPSIIQGFRAYPDITKNGPDVTLEDVSLDDGSIISILRSIECERTKTRGSMCPNCRAAQNRWAVRICRYKKNTTNPSKADL